MDTRRFDVGASTRVRLTYTRARCTITRVLVIPVDVLGILGLVLRRSTLVKDYY